MELAHQHLDELLRQDTGFTCVRHAHPLPSLNFESIGKIELSLNYLILKSIFVYFEYSRAG